MHKHKSNFALGDMVREKISGVEGRVVGITFWETGCNHVAVKRLGEPLLYRCNIGFGVHVPEIRDGYAILAVDPNTELQPGWGGKREFMQKIVDAWSATLARVPAEAEVQCADD